MPENRLQEIRKLQQGVHCWFWSSCPWGAGVLVEMVRTAPGFIYKALENQPIGFTESLPFQICFLIWWLQYERAEHKLINMERRNLAYAETNVGKLGVRYGFPERFIEKINLMHIKLRKPKKTGF